MTPVTEDTDGTTSGAICCGITQGFLLTSYSKIMEKDIQYLKKIIWCCNFLHVYNTLIFPRDRYDKPINP